MRNIFSKHLEREVSALGFGCASLGSRISARAGRRALDEAFERGVSWYDTAPPYGDGQSEAILGRFLAGKRDRVVLCTKVGIPRPGKSGLRGLAKPFLRGAINLLPELRVRLAAGRRTQMRTPITAEMIERSVTESLRSLNVEQVDILALHEPTPVEAADPKIYESLIRILDKGYARVLGIAGDVESALAGLSAFQHYGFVQISDDPFARNFDRLRAVIGTRRDVLCVTHSVLGVNGALARMEEALTERESLRAKLASLGSACGKAEGSAARLLLDYAFANNPHSTVLLSMYDRRHLAENVARANAIPDSGLKILLDEILTMDRDIG
jgi:aryl-alcohol dehydrogenase-like predicted oxidoreductase